MVGQSVSMVMHWILQINSQSGSSRNVRWHRPGLNVGYMYMYSWPGIFLGGEITVLCKTNEEEICWNQWILVNFGEFWWPNCEALFQTKKREKFQCIYCSYVGKISQTRWWIETKFCGMTKFHAAWTKFHIIKTKFRFFEVKFCFMERKFHTRLGRELFSWADVTFSIRVRIVYKSWSPSLVSSIKSSVQKTSSLTHRLQAPDRFCKKDENLFRFVPWQCFALAFSLKALLYLQSFWNGRPRKSNKRCKPFHFNCKARNAL